MSGAVESGICDICKKETHLQRKYYYYNIVCECHSPQHFELVRYCNDCIPLEPKLTKLEIKTETLKEL